MCLVGLVGLDFSWYDFSGSGWRIFPPPLHTVAPGEKSKWSGWFRCSDFSGSDSMIFPPPLRTVAPGEKSKRSGGFRRYDFGGSGWCGG